MSGRQVTLVECVLLLSGIGVLSVVARASLMARDINEAQSIDALLDCLRHEHGGGSGGLAVAAPQLVPRPDRRRFPRRQTRTDVPRPQPCWPPVTNPTSNRWTS